MSVVTLALAKGFLEITHVKQDTVVQALLDGVEDWLARDLGIALTSASRTDDLDGGDMYLYAPTRPVTALASVVDQWSSNAAYTAKLIGDGRFQRCDASGRTLDRWPEGAKRFRAVYTAGFGTLPGGLQLAILMLVKRAHDARAGESSISAAGASASWQQLAGSDIAAMLKPYARRRVLRV